MKSDENDESPAFAYGESVLLWLKREEKRRKERKLEASMREYIVTPFL